MKKTAASTLLFILGCNLAVAIPFAPKSHVILYSIRGGSDSDTEDDASSVHIETSVVENPIPIQAPVETSVQVQQTSVESVAKTGEEAATPAAVAVTPKAKKAMNPKLANAIERTGPAIVMLGAVVLLIKYTGEKGLLYGLIPLMQLGMYSESTGIIEAFHHMGQNDMEVKLEKWWWFATVFASTTLRSLGGIGKLSGGIMDLACFGMVAVGLVMAVVGMASHQSAGPEMFRKYLGEIAAFHFALVSMYGIVQLVMYYALGWRGCHVLFCNLLFKNLTFNGAFLFRFS
jgi:hypothetical protein